ncbi:MAG: hypothetical protein GX334_02110 [Firmicutes bacterium]|nr:hypothetical protein [Bacillota bacterium]
MLFWGLGLGLLAGFFLAGRVTGQGLAAVPFYLRFAQVQNAVQSSSQFDLRLMLDETRQKLEELTRQNRQLSLEVQDLREKVLAVEGMFSPIPMQGQALPAALRETAQPFPAVYSPSGTGTKLKVLACQPEIFRLCQEGVPPPEIARRLELGQGEVDLVLSLKGQQE